MAAGATLCFARAVVYVCAVFSITVSSRTIRNILLTKSTWPKVCRLGSAGVLKYEQTAPDFLPKRQGTHSGAQARRLRTSAWKFFLGICQSKRPELKTTHIPARAPFLQGGNGITIHDDHGVYGRLNMPASSWSSCWLGATHEPWHEHKSW